MTKDLKEAIDINYDLSRALNTLKSSYLEIYEIDIENDYYFMIYPEYKREFGKYVEAIDLHYQNDLIVKEDQDYVWDLTPEHIKINLKEKDSEDIRYRRCVNGKINWCQTTIAVHERNNGIPSKVIMGIRNVDDIVADERKAKAILTDALNEAKKASVAKTRFLSQMSHEIRTPLNAILGFTELAMKNNQSEQIGDYLEKIHSSSKHLLDLINQVLDMSRIESGKMTLDRKKVDLNSVVNDVLGILNNRIEEKKLNINKSIDIIHPFVYTDEVRLIQIFMNILNNSVKFSNNGGFINLSVTEVKYTAKQAFYQFIIRDSGIGFSEEFIEHAFVPFEREDCPEKMRIEGTGLGLPIVKSIVEMMNGTISLESKVKEGTTITITVAYDVVEGTGDTDYKSYYDKDIKGKRILVAEDNIMNQELVKIYLEDNDLDVTIATNGAEAIDYIKKNKYDLILMDCLMPVMDGYTAAAKIRETDKLIPIIAMTANAFTEDVSRSLKAGMNAHISKPIVLDALLPVLKKFL